MKCTDFYSAIDFVLLFLFHREQAGGLIQEMAYLGLCDSMKEGNYFFIV